MMVNEIIAQASKEKRTLLTEIESKKLIKAVSIPVTLPGQKMKRSVSVKK